MRNYKRNAERLSWTLIIPFVAPLLYGESFWDDYGKAGNVKVTYPQLASVEVGVGISKNIKRTEAVNGEESGFALYLEPGICATKIKIGYQDIGGFIPNGYRIQASYMNVYSGPYVKKGNYVGGDIEGNILNYVAQLGIYTGKNEVIGSIGIGIGF